ncbi:lysophospholipase L1-like esterase [Streptomonospora nanhaiensis]|uniref:Lysophospholipase L1-like esterase n=1 Tax=Streptomonospora nanhaiensis TaxID=1323731 RepID=A0A853BIY5_9ACTN|nr:lysophospholipase L1-like esterase [Streptomonospora nanhaiensis]
MTLDLHRDRLSYAALGDSFTEGVGDPYPDSAAGAHGHYRGWADRFAEHLAAQVPRLDYANLAVRGKLLRQVVAEQLPAALDMAPDLVTFSAGGNDVLRPGADPDRLADALEQAVRRLRGAGSEVVLFTGVNWSTGYMRVRIGLFARFYLNIRAVADRNGCYLVDQWAMRELLDPRAWDSDRLHMSPEGHRRLAVRVCEVLGVPVEDRPGDWPPLPPADPRARRRENARWAREFLVPWIGRRLTGRSSGDNVVAKRPRLEPLAAPRPEAPAGAPDPEG